MLNTKKLMKYARLYRARKKLKAKYEKLGKELEAMEGPLLTHMADEQTDKINLVGGYVVYTDTKIWPRLLASREEVIKALKECGHGDIVAESYNTNTLAAWLRELDMEEKELPEELQDFIEPNRVTSLISKKFK